MVLDEIKDFVTGTKDKINECIDSIKDHFKIFITGIVLNLFADLLIFIGYIIQILPKNPYANISFQPLLINLIFALVIPIIILFREKYPEIQKFDKFAEKFEMLNSISNVFSYCLGYFSVIICVYLLIPKYSNYLGITLIGMVIEMLFVIVAMLFIFVLNS